MQLKLVQESDDINSDIVYNNMILITYIAGSCNKSTDWGYIGTGNNFTCQLDLKKKNTEFGLCFHTQTNIYQLANTRVLI